MIKELIYKLFGKKFGDSTMYAIVKILGLKNIAGNQINPATYDAQTDGSQKAQIIDGIGNVIGSDLHLDGTYHLSVSAIQNILKDVNNSSTANLNAGATFTGIATSVLGVGSIQITLKTDVNCFVYIEQSPDGINWDVSDQFNYYYSIDNFGSTVQAVGVQYRVRVTNAGMTNSTFLRLASTLTPIANPLPRALDANGHFLTSVHGFEDAYGFEVENTPMGEMRVVVPTLLVGAAFDGTTVDPNFWTAIVTNAGSVTQPGASIVLATNTTANGTAKLYTARRARYSPGQALVTRLQLQLNNAGVANNVRRWGVANGVSMPTITDGAFFKLDGTTFSIVTMKGGVETIVSNGNFNGKLGGLFNPGTDINTYEIYYNNRHVYFTVGDKLLHDVDAATETWSNTMLFHSYLESSNSGGITSNNTLTCRVAGIRRLGALLSQPTSFYQAGTTAGKILKYGAGNLHGISISGVVNNSVVTLYDNTTASGTILWSSGTMSNQTVPFFIDMKGLTFSNGVTLVISSANCNATVIYE